MKMRLLSLVLGAFISFAAPSVQAATGGYTAMVNSVWIYAAAGSTPQLTLEPGTGTVGSCKMPPAVQRIFKINATAQGDKMVELLLKAQTTGLPVTVFWDDTKKDASGYCYIQHVAINTGS
jgi:hypothetical protein